MAGGGQSSLNSKVRSHQQAANYSACVPRVLGCGRRLPVKRKKLTSFGQSFERLRRENLELRQQSGYWQGMHARAAKREKALGE